MRQAVALAGTFGMLLLLGCGDEDPFGDIRADIREGSARIWEASAADLPGAFDFLSGRRLFLGSGDINENAGDIFLDGPPGATELRLRSVAGLIRTEPTHLVELQDLGLVDFASVDEAPEDGYLEARDTTGVAAVAGHVYVLRITGADFAERFAKIVIETLDNTAGSPDRQFIDFRYALQVQPGNRSFTDDEVEG
jgi:hypothetical protein